MSDLIMLLAKIDADIPHVEADRLLVNILNIVYFIAGIVAVIMIIIAGYNYMTSAGDSGKASKSMRTILYCVIGIVVIVIAFAITNFVGGRAAQV